MTPDPRPKEPPAPVYVVTVAGRVYDFRNTRAAADALKARLVAEGRRDVRVEVKS